MFAAPWPKTVVPPATRSPLICGGTSTGVLVGLGNVVAVPVGTAEGVVVGRLVPVGVAVAGAVVGVVVAGTLVGVAVAGTVVGVAVGACVPVVVGTGVEVGV